MSLLYPIAGEKFLTADLDWAADDIRVALYTSLALYDATHTNITDMPFGQQLHAGVSVTSKDPTDGYAVSAPPTYIVNTVLQLAIGIMYRFTDGLLIAYLDDIAGFPLVPRTNHEYALIPSGPGGAWFQIGPC
jgi:hypothetical protein